jgi:RNA polymerase sigma-70 factor (ECF subfamily)
VSAWRSDEELLAAADSDPEAFAALYRRHAPRLLAWCHRQTGDREAAADLVAETFAAALEGCHRYRPEKGAAAGWLFGIARHKLARLAERGRVEAGARKRLGLDRPEIDDAELDRVASRYAMDELLAGLPDDQRLAVTERVVEERDYAEIAERTDASEAAVRQRVSRGLATLRRGFGGGPPEQPLDAKPEADR